MQKNIDAKKMKKNKANNKLKIMKTEKPSKNNVLINNNSTSKQFATQIKQSITKDHPKMTPFKVMKESSNIPMYAQENRNFIKMCHNTTKTSQQEKDKLMNKFLVDSYSIGKVSRSLKFSIDETSEHHKIYETFEKSLVEYSITQYLRKTYKTMSDAVANKLLPTYDMLLQEIPTGMNNMFPFKDIISIVTSNNKTLKEEIESIHKSSITEAMLQLNLDLPCNIKKTCDSTCTAGLSFGSISDSGPLENNIEKDLLDAISNGRKDLVQYWLSLGANIEHINAQGFTPLALAILWGFDDVVKVLLLNAANTEATTKQTNDTPLSIACLLNRYEVCELLLEKKANMEHKNILGHTPLCLAAASGFTKIIQLLLKNKADINPQTSSTTKLSPLMLATINGHKNTVTILMDSGCDIHAQTTTKQGNKTAIVLACLNGEDEIALLILERLFDLNENGLTPLMIAAEVGYDDVGKLLINKGVDVNVKSILPSGDTALTLAVSNGRVNFVKLLLDNGACVQISNNEGCSPLWLAADGGYLDIVKLLYEFGADIDFENNEHITCLVAAFRKGHVAVVRWMLHHDFKIPNNYEWMKFCIEIIQT